MGTYLATGIVQEIAIGKKQIKYPDIKIDHITRQLKNALNLDCYNYSEDLEGYYFKIKPEMLEGNFVEFLTTQFQMCKRETKSMQNTIDKLSGITSGKELIKIAQDDTSPNFQLVPQIIEYVNVIRDNGFDEDVMIFYSLIAYLMDGKIITEGLSNSLRYFESNIRLQKDKYPITTCVRVMVTS